MMSDDTPRADVLIVTATPVESLAVMAIFKEATGQSPQPVRIANRVYHDLGEVNGAHVYMALSEMGAGGVGASQQTVQRAISALQPPIVIMAGIAFGVNEAKQAIGDVLVTQQLWLYDLKKVHNDSTIIPRGDKPHASGELINLFRSAHLYWKSSQWKDTEVRFGLVLTGDTLVDNHDYREQLKQFEPEAIGGEMEGAGLYVACQDAKIDWILVKAICDWADGNKGQDKAARQQTAATNAACFVLFTLQHVLLGGGHSIQKPSRLDDIHLLPKANSGTRGPVPCAAQAVPQATDIWAALGQEGITIILGRFLLESFEQSGLVGFGDVMALSELRAYLESRGLRNISVVYADLAHGNELQSNIVLLGGPDANAISREFITKVRPTIAPGDPDRHEIVIYDSGTGARYIPTRLSGINRVGVDYGIVISTRSPFAPSKHVIMLAGSFGYGTWAGVRFAISEQFLHHDQVQAGTSVECLIETDIVRETPQAIRLLVCRELHA